MTFTLRDNFSLGSAGITEGTAANTYQLARAVSYNINGRCFTKAVTDNIAFAAGTFPAFVQQIAQRVCAYFIMADTAGTLTVRQATQQPNVQSVNYVAGAFEWPDEPNLTCLGAVVVNTNAAATFTAGSVDLSAANVVGTYHNAGPDYGVPITY